MQVEDSNVDLNTGVRRQLLHDERALSVFFGHGPQPTSNPGIRSAPSSLGFRRELWNSTMTPDAVAAANNKDGPHGSTCREL
jgi:hypothetical protein